ncbi:MAG: hypothetical protein H0X51_05890 [Parachlamydiaceae bacterium]|nr:hypothetical protein [Parachlamydiaceae bacterium]
MKTFISYETELKQLFLSIIASPTQHAKWLNTLSYLENCGARKIAACEHPTLVKEEMLKHAAEEFRHAHHLKRQIEKITSDCLPDYSADYTLGNTGSLHYLQMLDVETCRYLKTIKLENSEIRSHAYALVTFAIELRAEELYKIYSTCLKETKSRVSVNSILLEEKEHLNEMRENIAAMPNGEHHANVICRFESVLFSRFYAAVKNRLLDQLD